jgi:hypothetical protein
MAGKYTKKIPEFVWMIDNGEWKQGPYVNCPRGYKDSPSLRKFRLVEVNEK